MTTETVTIERSKLKLALEAKKIGCVNHDCDKCNAQQQEPVGYWMGEFNDGAATLYEVPQESIFGRKYRNIPVYTTPPQRKPLGIKTIRRIATYCGEHITDEDAIEITRRVEEEHKIKE